MVALATKSHFADFSLLRASNMIAHGEYLIVTDDSYEEAHYAVLELLNLVRNSVSNAASSEKYRRSTNFETVLD
jgi:hypothetical protein